MTWNREEINFLRENYSKKIPLKIMSQKLNKTIKAIHHKAARENLSRKRFRLNNPQSKIPRSVTDKIYYEKNKEEIYKKRLIKRRSIKLELIKLLGGKCKFCGYKKCPNALEFHHNTFRKEKNLSVFIKNSSKQKSLKESKKCILLCANCHRELHYKGP